MRSVDTRIAGFDWPGVERDLDAQGSALLPGLLTPEACAELAGLSVSEMIDMLGRHGVAVIRTTDEDLERELADFS